MRRYTVMLFVVLGLSVLADEKANVSTNLLSDLVAAPNLGAEAPLGRHSSFHLDFTYSPFTFSDGVKWKFWALRPEFRIWPGKRLEGHFFGVHGIGGEFNFNKAVLLYNSWPELRDHRMEGWGIGGGLSYGYRWNFNRHWGLELEAGVGAVYTRYNKYRCGNCGERLSRGNRTYVGPTALSVALVYRFGAPKDARPALAELVPAAVPETVHDTLYIERVRVERDTVYRDILRDSPVKVSVTASQAMHLRYRLNSAEIDPALADNGAQIDSLLLFIERCQREPGLKVKSINIVGYASLEGGALENLRLSDARAQAAADLIVSLRPQLKPLVSAYGRGEDWESVEFPGKALLMRESDPERREQKLRALDGGRVFRELLESRLPATRRIECVIGFEP